MAAERNSSDERSPRYAVLIANWKGTGVVERCIESVIAAERQCDEAIHILVTDDASPDDSPDRIRGQFPDVELLAWEDNVGLGRALNRGLEHLQSDWVFLLNNDIVLQPDFFQVLINAQRSLGDSNVFMIGAQTIDGDTGAPNHAGMNARWDAGLLAQDPFDSEVLAESAFIQAGACLVDREKCVELGGFAPLYLPGYWEDYDICWQALKRGWSNYYEPRAVAFHRGKHSMRSLLGNRGLALMTKRNHLLFTWASLTDTGLMFRHFMGLWLLPFRRDRDEWLGAASWTSAIFAALKKSGEVLELRRERAGRVKVSDREILAMSNSGPSGDADHQTD